MTYSMDVRREAYRLFAEGLNGREVAAAIGVSWSVARLWRAQIGGMIKQPAVLSDRYLDRDERYEIARLRDAGHSLRAIGRALDRAPSTISRELARNDASKDTRTRKVPAGYHPERADQMSLQRRSRPKERKIVKNPRLKEWVQGRLTERFSPEQISGRLKVEFPDDQEMRISHEAIYQAIYVLPRGQFKRELRAHLRTGRTIRKARCTRQHRGKITDAVPIHDRPEEIEGRLVPGHYEGDLIVGPQGTTAAIGTLVERSTGHVTLFHLPDNRTAEATLAAMSQAVQTPGWPVRSITWDRGVEMAKHQQFTALTNIKVFFADPYSPWQRGTNENTNGLLREYFPKGKDLADYTPADLEHAANQLNNRPRKRLGFRTPNEAIHDMLNAELETGVATTP